MINEDITLKPIRKPPWDIRVIAVLCFVTGAIYTVAGLLWLLPSAKSIDLPANNYVYNLILLKSRVSFALYYIVSGLMVILIGRGIYKIRRWAWWIFVIWLFVEIDVRGTLDLIENQPYLYLAFKILSLSMFLWAIYRIRLYRPFRWMDEEE